MLEARLALITAGHEYPGASVCESAPHDAIIDAATTHAKYMASVGKQGHQYWTSRYWRLQRLAGKRHNYKEICAESWPGQDGLPLIEIGLEMFKCWEQSEGHWETAGDKHTWFGAHMARGENGIWYACLITGDKK